MTVADDLATLREALSVYHDIRGGETYAEQRAEQSQALDVLARELERLKRERDSARSANKELAAERDAERARADATEAEVARLRDGLRELLGYASQAITQKNRLPEVVGIQVTARSLLAEDGAALEQSGTCGPGCWPGHDCDVTSPTEDGAA